ncbi:hypothetical protein KSD_20810 [Ktedonobacter sp. SOSP1-85]|nr:hypothetical protein KSD_20810 [Ktedonobacter sp. SOSP1-85]
MAEPNLRGRRMECEGEGGKRGAENIEMVEVGDGEAFEMEVMIDRGAQG